LTDIGVVKGLIELQDEYTSTLGLADAALSNFSKHNQESLKAVSEAGALVAASFVAVAVATVEMGRRGSEVKDVENTLEHFTGSAAAAEEVMDKLRAGTKGTVDNFLLAKDAAHLLSAGVKLTADDFGLLGQAAFVMQNRGLGPTKDQLDLIERAMTTGRTRALAMSLGVIDVKDAEQDFADKLGTTADKLSMTGKAEAHRVAVLDILNRAVKDAGNQQLDFGEKLEKAEAGFENWIDEVNKAVAVSPVLAAGMDAAGKALSEAFGGDQKKSIEAVVHFIEQAVIVITDFGIAGIEGARVFNAAWSAVKTVILGVEGAVVSLASNITSTVLAVAEVAGKLHLIPDEEIQKLRDVNVALDETAQGLVEETKEAAKGVVGHSEFDKTLDQLGGTLFQVRDAMVEASEKARENNDVTDVAANNARILANTQKQLAQSYVDRSESEKEAAKVTKKSVEDTSKLWNDFYEMQRQHGTSSMDAQKAAIDKWFMNETDKLDKSDKNWQKHYNAIAAVANEKLRDITVDWTTLHEKSLTTLREQAEVARNTYNEMQRHAADFTREAMEEQLRKVKEAEEAAKGMGTAYKDAFDKAATAAQQLTDKLKAAKEAADAAKKANLDMGGSFEITRENFAASARGLGANPDVVEQLLQKGYSFQQALLWSKHPEWPPPANPGPRVAGFAQGGLVDVRVGEEGPETIRVPLGTTVFPNGVVPPNAGGDTFNIVVHVNGTGKEAARQFQEEMMRQLKMRRKFGAA